MILLRLISLQYARKHALRSFLNIAGIALGVAVWVAVHTANQSVFQALHQTVDRVAGATQLQISAGRTGFDESVLERIESLPEVRVAAPVVEAVIDTGLAGQGSLMLLGVDMTGDQSLRRYDVESGGDEVVDDPLTFLAQPDSVIITREFAARAGLSINSRIPMLTMEGNRQLTVRGIMRPGGLAQAFGGNLAVMDIYAAQTMLGRGRMFDRIDLAVSEGASVGQCREALEKMLGPGFQVEAPASRGRQLESVLRAYAVTADTCSLFGLFIGMFIIYNSFAIAVTERRLEIGVLRAVGATKAQIRALFLGESMVAGLAGSAIGVTAGRFAASGIAEYIGVVLQGMYGMAERAQEAPASPGLILSAFAAGVLTSMTAALLPAESAARVDPVEALQKGKYQVLSAGESRGRRIAAAAAATLSLLCLLLGRSKVPFYAGYILSILAALLITPSLAGWLARTLRPVLKRLRPIEGTLAADSLIQAPRRTSATVAALMISLALAVGMAGIARASYDSILSWLNTTLDADLLITTSDNVSTAAFRFPSSVGAEIEAIDGVAAALPVRSVRIVLGGKGVLVYAVDAAKLAARSPLQEKMYRAVARGGGLMVSENFAELRRVRVGDSIEIPAPAGLVRSPIVGLFEDYSNQQGTILMDRAVFRSGWSDDTVNVFRVYLRPGAVAEGVKQRILERFAGERRLFVLTNREVRGYVERLTGQWFRVTYVQIAVAMLVAILGIANTLTVSITDRRRELGVLQAVGGLRRQVRYAIWMEALAIGVIGLALGLALGAVNLYYSLEMARRDIAGMRFAYRFPVETALWLVPAILGAAWLSALGPAESAVRSSLVEALEYE